MRKTNKITKHISIENTCGEINMLQLKNGMFALLAKRGLLA